MTDLQAQFSFLGLVTEIHNKVGALAVMYLASKSKIQELYQTTSWYDPSLDKAENKDRMKSAGTAIAGYKEFLIELSIIGLAKTIEDIIVGIEEEFSYRYDIWRDHHVTSVFHNEAKIIRSLNNVIKHNCGVIRESNRPSGEYLVVNCGYPNELKISNIELCSTLSFDLLEKIAQVYIYLLNLVSEVANYPAPNLTAIPKNMKETVISRFVPDYLNVKSN